MLDERHVLTAAHCMYSDVAMRDAAALTVHVHRWNFSSPEAEAGSGEFGSGGSGGTCAEAIKVRRLAVHPSHSPPGPLELDVAVIELAAPARCADNEIDLVSLYAGPLPSEALQPPDWTVCAPPARERLPSISWKRSLQARSASASHTRVLGSRRTTVSARRRGCDHRRLGRALRS